MTTYKSLLEMLQQVRRDTYRNNPERDAALTLCMSYCLITVLEKLADDEDAKMRQFNQYPL